MELSSLYAEQDKLDQFIIKNLNMSPEEFSSVENIDKRVFALKVEIAEFANEVGWFKYWKQSHVMKQDKVLEELADVMHFFLSVAISRRYHTFIPEVDPQQWSKVPLEHLFRYIMQNTYSSSGQWKNGFEQLMMIGIKLGFEPEQMILAYYLKNQENVERQVRNY